MTALITQCPNCRTRFRVSGLQLSAARGMVRCGACLEMFDATQHLLPESAAATEPPAEQPQALPAAAPEPSAPPPPPTRPDTLLIHDDLDLESLELDEELSRLVREEMQLSQRQQEAQEPVAPSTTEQPSPEYDESWAEALLRAEGAAVTEELADEAPKLHPTRVEPTISLPSSAEPDETASAGPVAPSMRGLAPAREDPPAPLEIEDEPLRLRHGAQRRSGWRTLGWSLLTLLATGGLAAQYATYNFAELARIDSYRPWFERVCPHLGCTVPPLVDIAQIKSSNLVVRSHPEFAGALTVDAILYNRAPFPQPFPLLELRFADINGQLVASRRFKPSEYLAGELAGQVQMPPQIPIHIALDILDPGQNAVNYSLSFHSPD